MDVNLGLADNLSGIVSNILLMMSTGRALTILGLSVLTFKFLDLFLETNIKISTGKKVESEKMRLMFVSLALISFTVLPIVIIVIRMVNGDFRLDNALGLLMLSGASCLVIGIILKLQLPKGDPRRKQWIVLTDAFEIALDMIAQNIAFWIQAIIVRIINTFLEVLRGPFIMYYVLISTILNLALSFSITGFMGASQAAGEVNIIGSLIGGVAHAIVRKDKIKELKATYTEE